MDDGPTLTFIVFTSFVATLLLAIPTSVILRKLAVMDLPNHRSSHHQATVRGGGVACWAGVLVASLTAFAFGVSIPAWSLLAASLLAGVGLVDDVRPLPAVGRLGAQVAVGASLGLVLGGVELAILGAVVVPATVNAVNFMDGINGITALTVTAWAIVVILASMSGVTSVSVLAALSLGSALGFLPWNAFRPRMFLGDSGSYLFGTLIAATILESAASDSSPWLLITPMAVYLFDTGHTLLTRALRRQPIMVAHREHLYQNLTAGRNLPHFAVTALVASLALLIGLTWTHLAGVTAAAVTIIALFGYRALALNTWSLAKLGRAVR